MMFTRIGSFIKGLFAKIPYYLRGIVLFAIVIGFVTLGGDFSDRGQHKVEMDRISAEPSYNTDGINEKTLDYYFGDTNAPVKIIVYSNYECPHCLTLHKNVMDQLKSNYIDTGKVVFVPRMIINSKTLLAVMLPYCALTDQRYGLVEDLYANVGKWSHSQDQEKDLREIALRHGFTDEVFNRCIKNLDLARDLFNKQQDEARELQLTTLPTIFVNSQKFTGSMAFWELENAIQQASKTVI